MAKHGYPSGHTKHKMPGGHMMPGMPMKGMGGKKASGKKK